MKFCYKIDGGCNMRNLIKVIKKHSKRLLVGVLLLAIVTQTLAGSIAYAEPGNMNSNELGKAFIKLKKDQASLNDIDKSSIDANSLRIIALFLSNYYVSMSTVLESPKSSADSNGDDENKSENNGMYDKMVSALEGAGFKTSVAKSLVQLTMQKSLGTAKPLVLKAESGADGSRINTLMTYISAGYVKFPAPKDFENPAEILSKSPDGNTELKGCYRLTYGLLLGLLSQPQAVNIYYVTDYGSAPSERPVFCTDRVGLASYAIQNGRIDYSNGVGSSIYLDNEDSLKSIVDSADREVAQASFSFTAQLYVDWVGNIIMDTGRERVVVLPACNNPYAFKIIGGDSGGRLNLLSFASLSAMNSGDIYRYKTDANTPGNGGKEDRGDIYHESRYAVQIPTGDNKLAKLKNWRVVRGSNETNLDQSGKWLEPSWGKFDNIPKLFNKTGMKMKEGTQGSGDYAFFPSLQYRIRGKGGVSSLTPASNYAFLKLNASECVDGKDYKGTKGVLGMGTYPIFDNLGEGERFGMQKISVQNVASAWGDTKGACNKTENPKLTQNLGAGNTSLFTNAKANFGDVLGKVSDASVTNAIYFAYLIAYINYLDGGAVKKTPYESKYIIDMVFDGDNFPAVDDNTIDWDSISADAADEAKDEMNNELMSMAYYILHPLQGAKYFAVWAKNKICAFLLGWHEDMVGSTKSNSATGITTYLGFTGYTTLPSLHDLSWTSWLMENYNSIIVYLIIIIALILCCYVIVGHMTGQRAILGALMFGVLAFFPPVAINTTVNIVNTACDSIYGTKFSYWALVQHQSYLQDLYAALAGGADDYKTFLGKYQVTGTVVGEGDQQTDSGYTMVKLKWMSPKKDNYMVNYSKQLEESTEGNEEAKLVLSNLFSPALGNGISGQEFMEEPDALYLYRDYMDLSLYALKSYNLYSTYNGGSKASISEGDFRLQVGSKWVGSSDVKKMKYDSGFPMQRMVLANYEADTQYAEAGIRTKDLGQMSSLGHIRNGFMYNTFTTKETIDNKADYYHDTTLAVDYLLNYTEPYAYIMNSQEKLEDDIKNGKVDVGKDKLVTYGIPQNNFNFTMNSLSATDNTNYTKPLLNHFYFGLYSESPFYFLTYNLLDQMRSANVGYEFQLSKTNEVDLGKDGGFKDLLLEDNLGYFFNYSENAGDGYGELRDFMNMHDLFYYVMPMMKEGNDLVHQFDRVYGMKLFDDVKLSFTPDGYVEVMVDGARVKLKDVCTITGVDASSTDGEAISYKEATKNWSDEKIYKFWHNYNTITMYNAYSRWVDAMQDCRYAKKETIKVAGKKHVVVNPLDPTCYFEMDTKGNITSGRPMIFSESEKKFYGLTDSDLTLVEKKILDVQRSVYEKSIDLMNYYTFDDDVLVTAMAMLELFEFNKEFSQTSFVSEDFIMYPQSYELKAFTYDAYLRLILSNTTGDDLQSSEDATYGDLQIKTNKSLYERIMENTSITFGLLLIVLDILAVYVIPAFKLFFLIVLFIMSILLIIASAVKIELNILTVTWKSLVSPLLSFSAVSIGMAFLVSLFMYNGAKGVTGELVPTIQLGDPTMVVLVMIVINAIVVYLYFKICKATLKDFIKFAKAVWENLWGTVAGAFKVATGAILAGKIYKKLNSLGEGGSAGGGHSHDPVQSGKDNMPRPKTGTTGGGFTDGEGMSGAGAVAGAAGGALIARNMHEEAQDKQNRGKSTSSYDDKMASGKEKRTKADSQMDRAIGAEADKNAYRDRANQRRQLRDKAVSEGGLHNKAVAKYQDSRAKLDDRMANRRERQQNKHLDKAIKSDTRRREGKARLETAKANVRNSKVGTAVRQTRENTRIDYKPTNSYRMAKKAEVQSRVNYNRKATSSQKKLNKSKGSKSRSSSNSIGKRW